ncbi:hypothetical protein M758_3G106800 [Ceratodon purpureus]|nr:hypothetical protein M758_3G106800 [Ceratodon purpureus]
MARGEGLNREHLVVKEMLAGSIAGGLADGLMYPMMTVKSRIQVQGSGSSGSTGALYMYGGPLHAIRDIATKEGLRTFYKGSATILVGVSSTALYMTTYQTIKRHLPGGEDSPVVQFGGGMFATSVSSIVAVPVEVIRQRQMVQSACAGAYMGSIHTAKSIFQQEGLRAFYRGYLLNQMLCVPFNAVFMPLWEASKRACAQLSGAESVEKLELQYELGSAFFPSALAAALTNPMDVIKTRLQVQGKSNVYSRTQYSGAWDAAKEIYKYEGIAGFSSGLTSRMMWVAPSVMICFTTFDQIMKWVTPDT